MRRINQRFLMPQQLALSWHGNITLWHRSWCTWSWWPLAQLTLDFWHWFWCLQFHAPASLRGCQNWGFFGSTKHFNNGSRVTKNLLITIRWPQWAINWIVEKLRNVSINRLIRNYNWCPWFTCKKKLLRLSS
jgi:hypothetical protein